MPIQAGTILRSHLLPEDDFFAGAHILITSYDDNGATGFVFNRVFERKLNELVEFKDAAGITLYTGGPVDNEHIYLLHTVPSLGGDHISNGIYFGGDFTKAVMMLGNGQLSSAQVRLFLGYCGWDAGELENEIAEGSWKINESPADASLFS